MTKLVFSRTLKEATWKNSRIVPALDARELEALKRQPGKDMLLLGSGSIASQLTQHGLIDEYLLSIHPIVLGHGHRLFDDGFPPAAFDLTRTATTATGVIIATFRSNPPEPVR